MLMSTVVEYSDCDGWDGVLTYNLHVDSDLSFILLTLRILMECYQSAILFVLRTSSSWLLAVGM